MEANYRHIQNYNVFHRDNRDDLLLMGTALSGSPKDALDEVARREDLAPGKYVVISIDFLTIATGSVAHRVVMD